MQFDQIFLRVLAMYSKQTTSENSLAKPRNAEMTHVK